MARRDQGADALAFRQTARLGGAWVESAEASRTGVRVAADRVASTAPEPTDYWLASLGGQAVGWRRLVRLAKSRWRIEQDYRELKGELGLDHFEGRHWLGWHHHVTLVSMAFAFLRAEQARTKKNFWCDLADDSSSAAGGADPPGGTLSVVPDDLQ